jgi:uncharacterized repeat protein (TIGR03803 family)
MRRKVFWIGASCILVVLGLRPVFSSGAVPASTEKVIYSFQGGTDGATPMSDLTLDNEGNLYGTTSQGGAGTSCNGSGCGIVFELKRSQSGWKEEVLYRFTGGSDGGAPQTGVIFDKSGNLYGTTQLGGGDGYDGTVFKLTPNSSGRWTKIILYNFTGSADGANPQGDLIFDSQGNLYGTTSSGGNYTSCQFSGCGAVFELRPQADGSWTETTLHTFGGAPNDGGVPVGALVLDAAGSLYGTTTVGGAAHCLGRLGDLGCGTIFKLTARSGGTWKETVLYSFIQGYGYGLNPSGELVFYDVNHFLGLTQSGGDGLGTVFRLENTKKNGWQQRNPHIFFGNPDGIGPAGRLEVDAKGNLFGITSYGGTYEMGTVFELRRLVNGELKEAILYNFSAPPDGAFPAAGLVSDSQGHLYGTTAKGGEIVCGYSGCGTVYEVTP